jgi:hypothetical protein
MEQVYIYPGIVTIPVTVDSCNISLEKNNLYHFYNCRIWGYDNGGYEKLYLLGQWFSNILPLSPPW